MKKSMARVLAAERGDPFYVPETPCVRGHLHRRTSDGTCVECKQIAERARVANNREAYNARKRQERSKHLPVLAEKMRKSRASETPEKREQRLAKAREKQRAWRANNQHHAGTKASKKLYKQRNAPKVLASTIKRRVSKLQRTPAWLTPDDLWLLEQAYELAALRTRLLGVSFHVDHIIPLQGKYVSGLHVPTNVQVIPWYENVAKANKHLPA